MPEIGYLRAAEIGKRAAAEGRTVYEVARELTTLPAGRLKALLNPQNLADGGQVKEKA